jgi:hypothetical protein
MRTRNLAAFVVAAGLVLAVALPAAAKGPVGLTVTGPGGTRVELGGDEHDAIGPALPRLITELGLWRALGSDDVGAPPAFTAALPDGLDAEALGPRFRVDWSMYHGGGDIGDLLVTQFVYPDAPGGPVVFTPAGQPADPYIPATVGGWARTTGDVTATLAALGVDLSARTPAARPAPAPDGGPDMGWVLVGAVVATAVVGGAAVVHRRRSSALAAAG